MGSNYDAMNDTLRVTSNITSMISNFASSIPLTIYFLGFLNYFSLTSLYVLLNYRIPEQIFFYLSDAYGKLNENIFSFFGFEISVSALSN